MLCIVIEQDAAGFYAYCPALKGCHSQGESFEEAMHNIREAVTLYLETLPEEERARCTSKQITTTAVEARVA